jgi:hypothetical protein
MVELHGTLFVSRYGDILKFIWRLKRFLKRNVFVYVDCPMSKRAWNRPGRIPGYARCRKSWLEGIRWWSWRTRWKTSNQSRWRCESLLDQYAWTNLLYQIELQGRGYDDFIVPACPVCLQQGQIDRVVCALSISKLCFDMLVAEARCRVLRRIGPRNQES